MKVASMTEFPSNISDNIRTVAPQDAITAGFFALRDMDPDAVCPNNRERFARQCDHCIAEAVISAAYPLITARIDGLIAARLAAPVGMKEYGIDALIALRAEIAAGSAVPVATPEHDAGCERAYGQGVCACQRRADVHFSHTATGPVATPTDPMDEVVCPGCGATIRAQMSDRSTPERGAALEDLEHALTLALQAMAENDCCADEDDPDWRGPAIEQFRQDLRALGVRDAEMDAVGIKAPAEQDGQR